MERTTELSNRQLGLWNIWEKKQAENAGETYGYDQELDMSPENTTVMTGLEVCSACIFVLSRWQQSV